MLYTIWERYEFRSSKGIKWTNWFQLFDIKPVENKDDLKDKIKEAFSKIYVGGGFDGALIRCDFFVIGDEVYLNEINPNPGSLANYLFSDFSASLARLASNIKVEKKIPIDYKYIHSITSNKGKLA